MEHREIFNLIEPGGGPSDPTLIARVSLNVAQSKKLIAFMALLYSALLLQNILTVPIGEITELTPGLIGLIVVGLLPYLYFLSRPGILYTPATRQIVVREEGIEFPRKPLSKANISVNYADLLGVDVRGRGVSQFLVIETRWFTSQFPVSAFQQREDLLRVSELILRQLSLKSPEYIKEFDQRKSLSSEYLRTVPLATIILTLSIVAGYLLQQYFTGGALYRLPGVGANSALLLKHDEWFRLLSSSFLHSGLLHLLFNLAGLVALGYIIEAMLGSARFIAIYTSSLFVGSLFSAVHGNLLSVGASAPLFGLLGAYCYLHIVARKQLPIGFAMSRRWWVGVAILNIGLALLIPRVDFAAHLGGFLTGILTTCFLTIRSTAFSSPFASYRRFSFVATFAAALCVLAFTLAFIELHRQYVDDALRDKSNLSVMKAMLTKPGISPLELNSFAWDIAIDRHASKDMVKLAVRVARDAIILNKSANIADTYATTLYRVGEFNKAIDIEAPLALLSTSPLDREIYTSQLVRFIIARNIHTAHPDTRVLHANQTIEGPEHLLRLVEERTSGSTAFFIGTDKDGKESIILYDTQSKSSYDAVPDELRAFSKLRFIGTLKEHVLPEPLRVVPFSRDVQTYALFNPKEFSPNVEASPYERQVLDEGQLLI